MIFEHFMSKEYNPAVILYNYYVSIIILNDAGH